MENEATRRAKRAGKSFGVFGIKSSKNIGRLSNPAREARRESLGFWVQISKMGNEAEVDFVKMILGTFLVKDSRILWVRKHENL